MNSMFANIAKIMLIQKQKVIFSCKNWQIINFCKAGFTNYKLFYYLCLALSKTY
jgi:hypothetical protein